ncbi:uncharacterized protein LOC120265735 isoform X2 [Dioscorea cayenensis subsp. rotundata]|uniref:Uncharacterized protein LOC120265735 isoform X2 n=1 Tax=Dioscorea cayennensis subsp. rotundata TaxID=55577 RepID=A0AB40CHT2_DIOCR|nr:uncharacterized protein LOC120265735 isoform X2 [Dioscorea cayenensis subsp. rotundata]
MGGLCCILRRGRSIGRSSGCWFDGELTSMPDIGGEARFNHSSTKSSQILHAFTPSWTGKPGFSKKQADLFFPPDFADNFPIGKQKLQQLVGCMLLKEEGRLFLDN